MPLWKKENNTRMCTTPEMNKKRSPHVSCSATICTILTNICICELHKGGLHEQEKENKEIWKITVMLKIRHRLLSSVLERSHLETPEKNTPTKPEKLQEFHGSKYKRKQNSPLCWVVTEYKNSTFDLNTKNIFLFSGARVITGT